MKRQKNTDLALTGSRGRLYRRCVQKAGKMMPNRERISKTIRKARKIFERHTLLTKMLMLIGVSEETAAADACKLEHAISDESFEALKQYAAGILK